jgi:hypothetical protein
MGRNRNEVKAHKKPSKSKPGTKELLRSNATAAGESRLRRRTHLALLPKAGFRSSNFKFILFFVLGGAADESIGK